MPGFSWTVVKFNDENTVEAVPTSWIFNNQCYWPPFQRDKIITSIRKNEEPNTHWPSYEVTIFRNSTYENYMTAREKCKRAENTSDLNSEISAGKDNYEVEDKIKEVAQTRDVTSSITNRMTTEILFSEKSSQNTLSQRQLDSMEETLKPAAKQITQQNNNFANAEIENVFID